MIEKTIIVNDYLTKSHLPASDYVINPYIGCSHGCKYCYACFMKRFTHHEEPWGEFIDAKICVKEIEIAKLKNKSLFLSSVTDCYNPQEEKYQITRKILSQLINADCEVTIGTKSKLIVRDLDLLKQLKNLTVAISLNTLDDKFRADMDKASSVSERLNTLKILKENGIRTVLFISPIFPVITNPMEIIENSKEFVDQYWFENLNLRANFKSIIMEYIKVNYPQYLQIYNEIYNKKDKTFWKNLALELKEYCAEKGINYINYFYHEEIRR